MRVRGRVGLGRARGSVGVGDGEPRRQKSKATESAERILEKIFLSRIGGALGAVGGRKRAESGTGQAFGARA